MPRFGLYWRFLLPTGLGKFSLLRREQRNLQSGRHTHFQMDMAKVSSASFGEAETVDPAEIFLHSGITTLEFLRRNQGAGMQNLSCGTPPQSSNPNFSVLENQRCRQPLRPSMGNLLCTPTRRSDGKLPEGQASPALSLEGTGRLMSGLQTENHRTDGMVRGVAVVMEFSLTETY